MYSRISLPTIALSSKTLSFGPFVIDLLLVDLLSLPLCIAECSPYQRAFWHVSMSPSLILLSHVS